MTRARIAFAWLAALLISAGARAQDIEARLHGVVRLVSTAEEGRERVGAGFVVAMQTGAAYILTASHVVEGDPAPKVEFHGRRGRLVASRVLHLEGGQDRGLALLIVDAAGALPDTLTPLRLSAASARIGESVSAVGHPGGGVWQVININVAGRAGTDITLSGGLAEGNSGGPLLKDGEVIGVVTTVGHLGHATPAAIARIYLEGNGVSMAEGPAARQPAPSAARPAQRKPAAPAADPVKPDVTARTLGGVDYYEVDFAQGLTAKEVCRRVDKIPGRFATEPAVCKAFNPEAKVIVADRGDKAVAYCTGKEQAICGEYGNTCLSCPRCKAGVKADEWGGALYAKMYTTCESPGAAAAQTRDDLGGIRRVAFSTDNTDSIAGYFLVTGEGVWAETGPDGKEVGFKFSETGRDAGVIHLHDTKRGVELRLNLRRRVIFYKDASLPEPRPLYRIVGTE